MLQSAVGWIFPSGDAVVVPGVGYKSEANNDSTFTFSETKGERPFKGGTYIFVSGDFGVRVMLPTLGEVGEYRNVVYLSLPPKTALGLLCDNINPLRFSIIHLVGVPKLFIEYSAKTN